MKERIDQLLFYAAIANVVAVVLLTAFLLFYENANKTYMNAINEYEQGNYEAAQSELLKIEKYNFKNSSLYIIKAQEQIVLEAIEDGEYHKAYDYLADKENSDLKGMLADVLENNTDSKTLREAYGYLYELLEDNNLSTANVLNSLAETSIGKETVIEKATVSSIIRFGEYEQDNDLASKEEIEWLVLARDDDYLTVISLYGLDEVKYNDIPKFLDEFIKGSFDNEERGMISDYYILNYLSADKYFASDEDRICRTTPYAISNGTHVYEGKDVCWWWLDTSDLSGGPHTVRTDGHIKYVDTDINAEGYAIRPVLKIKIK